MTGEALHPLLSAAAKGELPSWAVVTPERRAHVASVARLLDEWADELDLDARDRRRWAAAAWLHDSLRDVDPVALEEAADYPPSLRHGPAAAARLRGAGVADEEVLEAIAFHTTGRPGLGRLGRHLYLADYLEPERSFDRETRAHLRGLMPHREPEVLRHVCARRIAFLLDRGLPLRPETVGFWNERVAGR